MVRDAVRPVAPDRGVIRVAVADRHAATGRVDGTVLPMGLTRSALTGGIVRIPEARAA